MTKVNNTSTLIDLKLQVINYHSGDNMDYLQRQMANDACYTSHNGVQYKKRQIADAIADFETAVEEGRDMKADAISRRLENMEVELAELLERHDADVAVFEIITNGETWTNQRTTKKPQLKDAAKRLAELKKKVAA